MSTPLLDRIAARSGAPCRCGRLIADHPHPTVAWASACYVDVYARIAQSPFTRSALAGTLPPKEVSR